MDEIRLIWTILERLYLILSVLYFLDYALNGKQDLPHKVIDWEELRMVQWAKKVQAWINKKLKREVD